MLEGIVKIKWSRNPAVDGDIFYYINLLKALSSPALHISDDGASIASLCILFLYLTMLIVKTFLYPF